MDLGKVFGYTAGKLVTEVACKGHKQATKYVSPKFTVKTTRQGKVDKRDHRQTILVTFGTPNYLEQRFIKQWQKAGEPFPVKKIQVKS